MNRRPHPSPHSLVVVLCIVATLWNLPTPLRAAPAREVSRSAALDQNMFVLLEEHPEESNFEQSVYTLTLRNLSDQEINLDNLQVRSPDSSYPAEILPGEDYEEERDSRANLADRSRSRSSTYTPYPTSGPMHLPSRCDEACVIFVVIMVVLIVGIIVIAVAENKRKEREREAEAAKAKEEAQKIVKGSIRLLRHQETTRKIIIPKESGRPIRDVMIEVNDQVRHQRVFKAEMGARPTS